MGKNRSNRADEPSLGRLQGLTRNKDTKIHFIGIGGVSMYSLAHLMLKQGLFVSGSDREASERTKKLSDIGARITIGHSRENILGADLVIYTHGINSENPELIAARELGIPTVSRARLLGALMMNYRRRIGVSGTHGKSTTTAMLDCIFYGEEATPTVLSGADLPCGEPYRIGSTDLMIYEACEYKDSFLNFLPTAAIALNLEFDHPDYFGDINVLKHSFTKALSRASEFALISGDDENLMAIRDKIKARVITFGRGEGNDYRYKIVGYLDRGCNFRVYKDGSALGDFTLNIPGDFNVANATAAIAVATESGICAENIAKRLAAFRGIDRRLQYIGKRHGREIYYDYAHHPTEIYASINALKMLTRSPLTVIFKPHTFSRTKSLWNEMCMALSLADYLILTDIYPAREEPIPLVTSERLAGNIGNGAIYCADEDVTLALDFYTKGAVVIMGAGDLERIKNEVIK